MNLKKLLTSQHKTPEQEYYLALEIHESLIKTACWKIEQKTPSIVSIGSFELWDSKESLVNGIDASLTSATKELSPKPQKTILGLPEPWLDGDKIHSSKTSIVKYIINELDLKPIGLVTTTQAIIRHLKNKEGVPPSAILLEIYPDKVTIAVVKLGKTEAMEEVGRSGELSKDVQEGLTRLNLKQLPPRFILSNGSDLEDEQQQLLSCPWQDNLSFLHLPKVEVLSADFSIEAIALAGGQEAVELPNNNLPSQDKPFVAKTQKTSISDIGFRLENPQENKEPTSVSIKKPPSVSTPTKKIKLSNLFNKINLKKPKLTLIIVTLLSVPLIVFLVFFNFATAKIIVTVQKEILSQTIDVYFGTEEKQNSNITLPLNIQTLSSSASESISTTGEALVGEKATGTITLINSSSSPISIKSGTNIESDNLNFLIESDVKVASASTRFENGIPKGEDYGETRGVTVTAAKIGTQYNLRKETQFSVGSHSRSVILAVAEGDFSGGTSRTVKAVSEKDQEKLLELTSEKVVSQINTKLKEQNSNASSLMISDITYTEKKYDKNIGQESNTLNLNLSGEVKMLIYSTDTILNQFKAKSIPVSNPGTTLLSEQTTIILSSPTKINENTYSAKAEIKAMLIPEIDKERFASQLKGKAVTKLKNILETIPGYQNTKIVIRPKVPFLSNYLPLNSTRILLEITTSK